MANKSFLYVNVTKADNKHQATFLGGLKLNETKWNTIQFDQACWHMQLIHCYDNIKFPFVIAMNSLTTKVFLVNSSTSQRIPLINVKQLHKDDSIDNIQQTSTFVATSLSKRSKDFTDLQEIILHFKLKLLNKDGED